MGQSLQSCSYCFNKGQYEETINPSITPNKNEQDVYNFNDYDKSPRYDEAKSQRFNYSSNTKVNNELPAPSFIEKENESIVENPSIKDDKSEKLKKLSTKKLEEKVIEKIIEKYSSKVINLLIKLQRFRKSLKDNNYISYTKEAKEFQKKNKQFLNYVTTKFVNKIEKTKPFKLSSWKDFYSDTEENKTKFKIDRSEDNKRLRLIEADSIYIGEVNSLNERNGYGCLTMLNGNKYKGIWIKNTLTGWCRIFIQNTMTEGIIFLYYLLIFKLTYLGYYENKDFNGMGEQITDSGVHFKGAFIKNLKEGKGNEKSNNYQYEGDFKNNKKDGKGKIKYFITNEEYEGDFKEDKINGTGTYIFSNRNTYSGTFLNGKMHGKGIFKWTDGSEYNGEYVNNIKEGKGKFKWKNGRVFEGPFKAGKQHGQGKLTYNNNTFPVEFSEGVLIKEKKPNKSLSKVNKNEETEKEKEKLERVEKQMNVNKIENINK